MGQQQDRYDAYPYPERNPADESRRLLTGSPSNLIELDHHVFAGRRDWSMPFRVFVAGGGTGDALVMLGQQLTDARVLHDIVYLDRSRAAREIAEARMKVRGLGSVTYLTGDLLEAERLGQFDYIDCCGVLHHLPDPLAGARRLAELLAPEGGIGGLVYAPLGRTGVYPMQSAFRTLLGALPYEAQIATAREVLAGLPKTNWLARNPFLGDHKVSDAGLFDLLLHTQDRAFWADELIGLMDDAGLRLESFVQAIRYDPLRHLPKGSEAARLCALLPPAARCRLAEELTGSLKTHIFYTRRAGATPLPEGIEPSQILHLVGTSAADLVASIMRGAEIRVALGGLDYAQRMHRSTAALLRHLDGRRTLAEAMALAGMEELAPPTRRDLEFLRDAGRLCASGAVARNGPRP